MKIAGYMVQHDDGDGCYEWAMQLEKADKAEVEILQPRYNKKPVALFGSRKEAKDAIRRTVAYYQLVEDQDEVKFSRRLKVVPLVRVGGGA